MEEFKVIHDETPPDKLKISTDITDPPVLTVDMIREIMDRYNVSAKTLSKLVGWNSDSIFRYLAGNIPKNIRPWRVASLVELYLSPLAMDSLLESKKTDLSASVYKRSRIKLDAILLAEYGKPKSRAEEVARFMTTRIVELVFNQPGASWSEEEKAEILSFFPLANTINQGGTGR